jgi:hypothetical protein
MKPSHVLYFLLLTCLICDASTQANDHLDLALQWFHSEYGYFFEPSPIDFTPPSIAEVTVSPSILKYGDPRAEIRAKIRDPSGIRIAYAEVGSRMKLMLDVMRTSQYTGYCGSNLPAGTYRVSIVAMDKAGNAARTEAVTNLTILDPRDLNDNHIEDSLEKRLDKELRVIVLRNDNLSVNVTDRLKLLPVSSMVVPGSKLDELSHLKGVRGIYEDQRLKIQAS